MKGVGSGLDKRNMGSSGRVSKKERESTSIINGKVDVNAESNENRSVAKKKRGRPCKKRKVRPYTEETVGVSSGDSKVGTIVGTSGPRIRVGKLVKEKGKATLTQNQERDANAPKKKRGRPCKKRKVQPYTEETVGVSSTDDATVGTILGTSGSRIRVGKLVKEKGKATLTYNQKLDANAPKKKRGRPCKNTKVESNSEARVRVRLGTDAKIGTVVGAGGPRIGVGKLVKEKGKATLTYNQKLEANAPKKKRGRPCKNTKVESNSEARVRVRLGNDAKIGTVVGAGGPIIRVGKLFKNKGKALTTSNHKVGVNAEHYTAAIILKKKQGRPPKDKKVGSNAENERVSTGGEADNVTFVGTSRPRIRVGKLANQKGKAMSTSSQKVDVNAPKKKRGRPCKERKMESEESVQVSSGVDTTIGTVVGTSGPTIGVRKLFKKGKATTTYNQTLDFNAPKKKRGRPCKDRKLENNTEERVRVGSVDDARIETVIGTSGPSIGKLFKKKGTATATYNQKIDVNAEHYTATTILKKNRRRPPKEKEVEGSAEKKGRVGASDGAAIVTFRGTSRPSIWHGKVSKTNGNGTCTTSSRKTDVSADTNKETIVPKRKRGRPLKNRRVETTVEEKVRVRRGVKKGGLVDYAGKEKDEGTVVDMTASLSEGEVGKHINKSEEGRRKAKGQMVESSVQPLDKDDNEVVSRALRSSTVPQFYRKGGVALKPLSKKVNRGSRSGDMAEQKKAKTALRISAKESNSNKRFSMRARGLTVESGSSGKDFWLYKGPRTLLSWMIHMGSLSVGAKLTCINRRKVLRVGKVTGDGINCDCCNQVFAVSDFDRHSGSLLGHPFRSIRLDPKTSLLQCLSDTWSKYAESVALGFHSLAPYGEDQNDDKDQNDDTCNICGDGGILICCDSCPSAIHQKCLNIKNFPSGDWNCTYCCCKFCGNFGERTVDEDRNYDESVPALPTCRLCEENYHPVCAQGMSLNEEPYSHEFCSKTCQQIMDELEMCLGVQHHLEEGFSWSFIQYSKDCLDISSESGGITVESNAKLALAWSVMDECFEPVIDKRTKMNVIRNVVYSCGSNIRRLNYTGFFIAILERGDEIISAATIRIHGNLLAEMPFVGTREAYRCQGMSRRLINAVEMALGSMNVEKLVLPAISDKKQMWTNSFGFKPVENSLKKKMKYMNIIVFPKVDMLQKSLI